jgi:hypothetical protein
LGPYREWRRDIRLSEAQTEGGSGCHLSFDTLVIEDEEAGEDFLVGEIGGIESAMPDS